MIRPLSLLVTMSLLCPPAAAAVVRTAIPCADAPAEGAFALVAEHASRLESMALAGTASEAYRQGYADALETLLPCGASPEDHPAVDAAQRAISIVRASAAAKRSIQPQTTTIITGTVRDLDGAAVAGATVTGYRSGYVGPPVTTNASGVFEYANLPSGDVDLEVIAEGFRRKKVRIQVSWLESLDVPITIERGGRITGTMKDSVTNAPLAGGWVKVFSSSGTSVATIQTDSAGQWSVREGFAAGNYFVTGVAADHSGELFDGLPCFPYDHQSGRCNPTTGTPVPLTVGGTAVVDLQLAPGASISGTVTATNGGPVHAVVITVRRGDGAQYQVLSGPDGTWSTPVLLAETYRVSVMDSRFNAQMYDGVACTEWCNWSQATPIALGSNDVTNVNFHLTPRTGGVRGRITDRVTGLPVENATFSLGPYNVRTDASGAYSIPLAPGMYFDFRIFHPLYVSHSVGGGDCSSNSCPPSAPFVITADTYLERNATLSPRAEIRGRLTDAATGLPIAGTVDVHVNGAYTGTLAAGSDGYYAGGFGQGDAVRLIASSSEHLPRPHGAPTCTSSIGCTISLSTVITASATPQVADFALSRGASLTVYLETVSGGAANAGVSVGNAAGNEVATPWVSHPVMLLPGRYFAKAVTQDGRDVLYDGIRCDPCSFIDGTPIDLVAGERRSITITVDAPAGVINGTVRDRSTGRPLAGVDVVADGWASERTNSKGEYHFYNAGLTGSVTLEARLAGYVSQRYSGHDCEPRCEGGDTVTVVPGSVLNGIDFSLTAHRLTRVFPVGGPEAGGTSVVIYGGGFEPGCVVRFGGATAAIEWITPREMRVTAPAHTAGQVELTVTNPDGHTARLARAYRYGNFPVPSQLRNLTPENIHNAPASLTLSADDTHLYIGASPMVYRSAGSLDSTIPFFNDYLPQARAYRAGPSWVRVLAGETSWQLVRMIGVYDGPVLFESSTEIRFVTGNRDYGFFNACAVSGPCGSWSVDGAGTVKYLGNVVAGATGPYGYWSSTSLGGALFVILASEPGTIVRLDGETPDGVVLVRMGRLTSVSSWTVEGKLWLLFSDEGSRNVLYVSDGTPAGTQALMEGSGFSTPVAHEGSVWFAATPVGGVKRWYSSDGTRAGTVAHGTSAAYHYSIPVSFNGHLYYAGFAPPFGVSLWRSNGELPDVEVFNAAPHTVEQELVVANGKLYFSTMGQSSWQGALWMTDGTTAGTAQVSVPDRLPDSDVSQLRSFDTALAFVTLDRGGVGQAWILDAAGARRVTDFRATSGGPSDGTAPVVLPAMHAAVGIGPETYYISSGVTATDGTVAGTKQLSPAICRHTGAISIGSYVLFTCSGQLTSSDGATVTTLGGGPDAYHTLNRAGDAAYFVRQWELWRTNGTTDGTFKVRPGFATLHGTDSRFAYFSAGTEFMRTDGTAEGTRTLAGSGGFSGAVAALGRTFTMNAGGELWRVNDAADGLIYEATPPPGLNLAGGSDRALFLRSGYEVESFWAYDGELRRLIDIEPRQVIFTPGGMFIAAAWPLDALYFSDGTADGTQLLEGVQFVRVAAIHDGVMYFIGYDDRNGATLWRSDGSAERTYPVFATVPPVESAAIWNGLLVGSMYTVEQGWELFTAGAVGCTSPLAAAPGSRNIPAGSSTILRPRIIGSGPFTVTWYRGMTGDVSQPIPSDSAGAATVSLAGRYWYRATGACGQSDSPATVVEIARDVAISFAAPRSSVSENENEVRVAVRLQTGDGLPLQVKATVRWEVDTTRSSYSVSYTRSGSLEFGPGSANGAVQYITLQLSPHTHPDRNGTKRFFLRIADPTDARIAAAQHEVMVLDEQSSTGSFFTVNPCRAYDSRVTGGPVVSGQERTIYLWSCGVPESARAAVVNVTIVSPTSAGHLTLFGYQAQIPVASTINFSAGQVRANNATVPTSDWGGMFTLRPFVMWDGTVHVIIDITGYYE